MAIGSVASQMESAELERTTVDILAEVDARINGFTAIIGDAYREQEARLTEPGKN